MTNILKLAHLVAITKKLSWQLVKLGWRNKTMVLTAQNVALLTYNYAAEQLPKEEL